MGETEEEVTEVRPLYYFGTPTERQRHLLVEGKKLLDVDFMVIPKRVTEDAELPAIAFEHPPYAYLHGYAYVANADTPMKFRNALAAIYGIEYTEYLTGPAEWFARIGFEVTEVFNDNDDA